MMRRAAEMAFASRALVFPGGRVDDTDADGLDVARVRPWGRWVTPRTERRRFHTSCFVATLPPNAVARCANSEADSAGWLDARDVLESAAHGDMLGLPPTTVMLRGLVAAGSVASVVVAAPTRSLAPRTSQGPP